MPKKVYTYYSLFYLNFCLVFTAVAIIFHSITFIRYLSFDVTGSMKCKQIITFEAVQLVFHKHDILSCIVFMTNPCQASLRKVKL